MHIGVPKEIKIHEYRVGLTPSAVSELCRLGHQVSVETGAGAGIDMSDDDYRAAGANILTTAAEIFAKADMVVKVKEPQPVECQMLRKGQILFTYLHLAPDPEQTKLLMASGASCIAYETVEDDKGRLPLLAPMSEVAGRLSVQIGAHYLEKAQGGRGILLSGVAGVAPATVVVLGAGVAGFNAMQLAVGLGTQVVVMDKSLARLREIDHIYHGRVITMHATQNVIDHYVQWADLVIGAVLVPGANAPKLVTREMLKKMKRGSVLVDIAIDQGGCFETSRPTTHTDPVYEVDGVLHYCVTNMPGAVPRTSTYALGSATMPYVIALAQNGLAALKTDKGFMAGLNVHGGQITCEAVARAQNLPFVTAQAAIG
ncbi:MAG TPA: alanine dehydrogenase [Alphaproteobacteria bacterium]|nr:alanine dehydrogenase [Rhodospirillaceae bacterium]HRJ13079.1 alanine dehydrogenase [Alphaproteobacteria bacterium]